MEEQSREDEQFAQEMISRREDGQFAQEMISRLADPIISQLQTDQSYNTKLHSLLQKTLAAKARALECEIVELRASGKAERMKCSANERIKIKLEDAIRVSWCQEEIARLELKLHELGVKYDEVAQKDVEQTSQFQKVDEELRVRKEALEKLKDLHALNEEKYLVDVAEQQMRLDHERSSMLLEAKQRRIEDEALEMTLHQQEKVRSCLKHRF
jgi:hypothetical protein